MYFVNGVRQLTFDSKREIIYVYIMCIRQEEQMENTGRRVLVAEIEGWCVIAWLNPATSPQLTCIHVVVHLSKNCQNSALQSHKNQQCAIITQEPANGLTTKRVTTQVIAMKG